MGIIDPSPQFLLKIHLKNENALKSTITKKLQIKDMDQHFNVSEIPKYFAVKYLNIVKLL